MNDRNRKNRSGRPAIPKAMLLPLSTDHVRRLQLQHHLALAALANGQGNVEQLSCLISVARLSGLLRDAGATADGPGLHEQAEDALNACLARAAFDDIWSLRTDEQTTIAQLLVAHDAQLASVRMYRYLEAWERLQRTDAVAGSFPVPGVDTSCASETTTPAPGVSTRD